MFDFSPTAFFEFCRNLSALLFLWSWQSALLLALTFCIARFNRFRSAEIRHKIWLAGLVAVALLPLWSSVSRWLLTDQIAALPQIDKLPAALVLAADINNAAERANVSRLDWLAAFACGVWLFGVLIYLIRFFISGWKMRRVISFSQPLAADFYESSNTDAEQSFSLPPNVALRSSAEISNPTLKGFFRPIILFPADIEEWTSEAERRAIIRHELAHLERLDHYGQILQLFLKTVFFFHPLVRFALNQLSFERELACDEKVIVSGIRSREYTEVILKVAEHDIKRREGWQLTFTPKKQLHRRIYQIMNNRNQSLSKGWRFLLLAKTAVLLALVVWFITPNQTSAQSSLANNQANKISTADEKTTESFKRLYESIKEAMLKGDKAAFEKFFADDYTAVSARGTTMTKQQVIDLHTQKPNADAKLEKLDFSDLQVKTYGDTVIATYLAEMTGQHMGMKFSQKVRITDVWKKNGDKWQSVASHASTVAQ